ncbi:MAG TPA: NAD(P)H-binding protein [Bacteroidales bacterium]|nr:NAD(P)H-binding protein [Bacteroidales bacterium]
MKAVILGASGLTGSFLTQQLIADEKFTEIVALTRRHLNIQSPRLTNHVVDFSKPEQWAGYVVGDVLFLCMGTTRRDAKSKKAQYEVDYTFQYQAAKAAKNNGVTSCVIVSSMGANAKSFFFYTRMKGELDERIRLMEFDNYVILRPGQIEGKRHKPRLAETIAVSIMHCMNSFGILSKYTPIHAQKLATAMINGALLGSGTQVFTLHEVHQLSEKTSP